MAKTDSHVDRVLTIDPDTAEVLASDVRATILDLLDDRARTIPDIQAALDDDGHDLAETSVRHHVGVLEDAGMLRVVRREDVNGGTRKHYRATTRLYTCTPDDVESELAAMDGMVRAELASLCSRLAATHRDDLEDAAAALDDDCGRGDPRAYLLRALLDRAVTDLETSGALDDRLPPL